MTNLLTLSAFLFFVAINFLLALCYTFITGKKPSAQLSLFEINDNIKNKGGGWIVLIPIVSILILLFNVLVNAFWFVGVVFEFLAWLLKWIWVEIIISGGVFIFSIFWHYLIKWPWKLLIHGFTLIKSSLKLTYLLIGVLTLFCSLGIMFIGRFSIEIFELPKWVSYVFSLFSIFPIGIGLSWVIQKISNKDNADSKEATSKYFRHLFYIITAFTAVIVIQLLLIYLGTFTSLTSLISSVFVGTNLLGSFILIINSIVILFALAALPSFSNTYEGSDRYLLLEFFKYLVKNNWGKYLISGPSILIPAIIACIAPFVITQGVSYLAGMVSSNVFEYKLQQLTKDNDEIVNANYEEWLDIKKTSDESLSNLKVKDVKKRHLIIDSKNTRSIQAYLNNFYNIHSSEYGAAPVGALIYLFDKYTFIESNAIKTSPFNPEIISSDTSFLNKLNSQIIPEQTSTIQSLDKQIIELNAELDAVCKESTAPKQTNSTPPQNNIRQNDGNKEEPVVDNCVLQRQSIQKRISNTKEEKQNTERSLLRSKEVAQHLINVYNIEASNNSSSSSSSKVAYLFVSLWLCLLIAIAFSPIIPLYAQINHYLYNQDDDGELYVAKKIKESYNRNQNQPLLGIILFSVIFTTLYTSANLKGSDLLDSISKITDTEFLSSLPNLQLPDVNKVSGENASTSNEDASNVDATVPLVDTTAATPDISAQENMEGMEDVDEIIYESDDLNEAPKYKGNSFNYNNKLHEDNGAPEESYTVVVTFVINTDGSLSDIKALTKHGYGLEDEIVDKISTTSGDWEPGRKDGNKVRSRGRFTFKFE